MAFRSWLRSTLEWLVYSAAWIATCAVALCLESAWVLQVHTPAPSILLFVAAATFCHYNIHYFLRERHLALSHRDRWSERYRYWFVPTITVGGCISLGCLFSFSREELLALTMTGGISVLYSLPVLPRGYRLKQLGILKPFILAAVWTIITVWLPAHEAEPLLLSLVLARRFVFMLALCLAFDVRDQDKDAHQGIRTIPVLIGSTITYRLIDGLLMLFALFALLVEYHLHRPWILAALLTSTLLTRCVISATKRFNSELYYLGVIDGMMVLQALLVWGASMT